MTRKYSRTKTSRAIWYAMILSVLLSSIPAWGETFYVAPDGDDTNPGTIDKPLATLAGARDKVRSVLDGQRDIMVYFRGGYYYFTETVVFGLEDSGSENQVITYRNYPGETPIFTSGVHVTGWSRISPDELRYSFLPGKARSRVYVANIPKGLKLIRNLVDRSDGWLDHGRIGVTDYITTEHFKHCSMVESEMYDPADEKKIAEFSKSLEGLSNADTALEFRIYNTDYNMNLLAVASIEGNKLTTQVPGTYRLAPPPPHHQEWKGKFEVVWIENVLEGLDKPGEWVCNTQTGKIYLWPKSGTDDIYAPTLTEFVRVEGDIDYQGPADKPVEYLSFEGITFTNGERAVWEEGDSGVQHDWAMCDKANALLRFRGAENCRAKNCTFTRSGGVGVRLDLHAQHNTVENCLFEYLGYEAVQFCGYGIGKKDVNKNNIFVNNTIHDIGQAKWDAPAIVIWNSGYNRIAHNYIHHVPHKAVLLSAPRSRAFTKDTAMREQAWPMARWDEVGKEAHAKVIRRGRNRPRRTVNVDDRICAQYRYLRGNVVEKNTLHDISESVWGDGIFYVTAVANYPNPPHDLNKIVGNYIYNCDGNSDEVKSGFFRGLYLDSFMGNLEVHRNVWYNCKMSLEVNQFAINYDKAYPTANVFYNVSPRENIMVYRRSRTQPQGTLIYSVGDADEAENADHDPRPEFLNDYISIYHNLDSLPGVVEGKDRIKEKLKEVINQLGGDLTVR